MTQERPPATHVGYTREQRAAIRAVEEEGMLDLINDFLRRANNVAERLESYAVTPPKHRRAGEI